jgi:hypothetical protein
MLETLRPLSEFGTRSLLLHGMMALTFLAALGSAFLLEGQLGLVSFVAFVNLTAGMWLSQSIHSLGNAFTDDDYDGVMGQL